MHENMIECECAQDGPLVSRGLGAVCCPVEPILHPEGGSLLYLASYTPLTYSSLIISLLYLGSYTQLLLLCLPYSLDLFIHLTSHI